MAGTTGLLGRWVYWAVHGLVHGWCMGAWWWWCGGGVVNDVLYYLDWGWLGGGGGRRIGGVGPDHWGSPGLMIVVVR